MSATARKPDDLAAPGLNPDDCYVFGEECEYAIQSNRKRATAIGYFAGEMGVRFQDVRCARAYIAFLTRQEAYDTQDADDHAFWEWFDNHEPPLTCRTEDKHFRCYLPDGTEAKPPEFDPTVPDDWEPQEDCPVWAFCEKRAPGAIACWQLEERS